MFEPPRLALFLLVLAAGATVLIGLHAADSAAEDALATSVLDADPRSSQTTDADDGSDTSRYRGTITAISSIDTVTVRREDGVERVVRLAGISSLPTDVRDCRPSPDTAARPRRADRDGPGARTDDGGEGHPGAGGSGAGLVPATMQPGRRVVVEAADRSRPRPDGRTRLVYLSTADGDRSINAELIRGGWADVQAGGRYEERDRYRRLAFRARDERRGAWRCQRTDGSTVDGIPDGTADDLGILRVDSSRNASGDRVVLWNRRDRRLGFGGWQLRTAHGSTYRLPDDFNVIGRGKVTVVAGRGRSSPHRLYMDRVEPFVGRSDAVELVHPDGTVADRRPSDAGPDPRVTVPLREELPGRNGSDADGG